MTTTTPTAAATEKARQAATRAAQAEAIERLVELRLARKQLDRDEVEAVAAARTAGVTWREMAGPMGSTFQHLQKHFTPLLQVKVQVAAASESDGPPTGQRARRRGRSPR